MIPDELEGEMSSGSSPEAEPDLAKSPCTQSEKRDSEDFHAVELKLQNFSYTNKVGCSCLSCHIYINNIFFSLSLLCGYLHHSAC